MAGDSARDFARHQREKAARLERSAEMWERGAQGEAATASALSALAAFGWSIFHDVRWPGRPRANIDHVAVGPTGVFVIDSKNWSGDIRIVDDVLYQGDRRREREVAAAADAALAVTQLLQGLSATPVLCFARQEPVDGKARGVIVCSTQNLAVTLANQPPILGPESMRRVSTILQWQLTSAMEPSLTGVRASQASYTRRSRAMSSPRRPPSVNKVVRRVIAASLGLLMALVLVGVAVGLVGAALQGARQGATGGVGAQRSSAPVLGDAITIRQTESHPALRVQADKLMRVGVRPGYPLQPDQHLVAVRYAIRNAGSQLWGATSPYLQFSALASNGQRVPSASYSDLPPSKLMPAAFNLPPRKVRQGFVVFLVPDGAKLVRVSVQTYFGSSDSAEWLIP